MSFWSELESRLSACSSDAPRELSMMVEKVCGISSDQFLVRRLIRSLPEPTEEQKSALCDLVSRRSAGEPLQYLLGFADFYGRTFAVAPGVLIPRFDTEVLVDTALSLLKDGDSVLDLCAGTGCIGLTLGAEKSLSVTEVEKFDDAFALLEQNAKKNCPSARLILGDVLSDDVDGCYDLIVSNPPYIPTDDLQTLSAEVKNEPVTALDGGEDGLLFYRCIIQRFASRLKPGGSLLFECGIGQAFAIEEMLISAGFSDPIKVRDYGGVLRVVGAKK